MTPGTLAVGSIRGVLPDRTVRSVAGAAFRSAGPAVCAGRRRCCPRPASWSRASRRVRWTSRLLTGVWTTLRRCGRRGPGDHTRCAGAGRDRCRPPCGARAPPEGRRHRHHNRTGALADPHMRGFFQPQ